MNNRIAWLPLAAIFFASCNQEKVISDKTTLATPKEQHSYAVGMDMGRTLKQIEVELDHSLVLKGVHDQLAGNTPLLQDSAFSAALQDLMATMRQARATKDSIAGAENLTKQKDFLEKNKSEAGVVTLPSGLQYMILAEGSGALPTPTDLITAHYAGSLLDGTEFDSSIKRGQPITFPLARVIPGWQQLLPLLKVGTKVKTWIPSDLAYGPMGSPPAIPPNSLLVFEMELISATADTTAKK